MDNRNWCLGGKSGDWSCDWSGDRSGDGSGDRSGDWSGDRLGGGLRDLEKREVGKKMKNRPWIITLDVEM